MSIFLRAVAEHSRAQYWHKQSSYVILSPWLLVKTAKRIEMVLDTEVGGKNGDTALSGGPDSPRGGAGQWEQPTYLPL